MTTKISQNLLQPGQRLIYENTLTATANLIDIPNLDGLADGGYTIEIDYYNTAKNVAETLFHFSGYIYFNGDYTNANYDYHFMYASQVALSVNNGTTSAYAWYTDKNGPCQLRIDVNIVDNNGTKYARANIDNSNITDRSIHTVSYDNSITNITDIRVHGAGVSASPFEIGTVIRVFRKL